MRRRRFLGLVASGVFPTAGCLSAPDRDRAPDRDAPFSTDSPATANLPVDRGALFQALERDAIPAIIDPQFDTNWDGLRITVASAPYRESIQPRLSAGSPVIGVERNGRARAYPLALLNWHEVVNDQFGGPLLITYCPLCQSGIVAERTVDGQPTVFGVSGFLWHENLVLYDRATGSLWSQLLAKAIHGPKTGSSLRIVPSSLTTWSEWRTEYPESEVLLPPPHSNTLRGQDATFNYMTNSYLGYAASAQIGTGNTAFADRRLDPKTPVIGIATNDAAKAYSLHLLADERVINDTVGDRPVVVAITPDRSLVAYDRRLNGRMLWFLPESEGTMFADRSRWQVSSGQAIDGPHDGAQLTPATDKSSMFWFAWAKFHPQTDVYGQ